MNESNRHTLQDALHQLPKHEAPASIWEAIETDMDQPRSRIKEEIRQLPSYRAPEQVWHGIQRRLKRPRLQRWGVAVAASIALLIAAAWLMRPQSTVSELPIQASERRAPQQLVLPEAMPADFVDDLGEEVAGILDCLPTRNQWSPELMAKWSQLQLLAAEDTAMSDMTKTMRTEQFSVLLKELQAAYCEE